MISLCSKKQIALIISSTESEYRALALATSDIVWIQHYSQKLDNLFLIFQSFSVTILVLVLWPLIQCFVPVRKHIEIDLHSIREKVLTRQLDFRYVDYENQIANLLTNPLSASKFNFFFMTSYYVVCTNISRGDVGITE